MSDQKSPADELLELLKNPFKQPLTDGAIWSALGTSVGITIITALIFSLVRPYHTVIYAPKLKHADEKHAPPPIGKGFFAWIMPLWRTTEKDLVAHAGMDAALFIRVMQMCRNIFLIIAILGTSILLPIYWTLNSDKGPLQKWFLRFTPANVWGEPIWALVVIGLRRTYFESEEYQRSLSARTLMLNDIPKNMASDEGVARIIDSAVPQSSFSRTVIARNVKLIPSLIEQHDHTVRKLEKVLAKYLKDPQHLPPARPLCYPSKKDPSYGTYPKGQKIDAIDYLTQRIRELELEIKEVRSTLDKRNTFSYGFASYDDITEAHAIAYTLRKKKPLGATVVLAPKPDDIIWDNMHLSPSTRSWRRLTNNLWIILLTFLWIAPNALIAIFVSNLSNLGLVWDAFKDQLSINTVFWAIVQGVASPAVTSLTYLVLPIIFRRLSMRAGDRTKTGRDRHVVAKLYAFFIFNNLVVFSLFNTVWSFIVTVVDTTSKGTDVGNAILNSKFFETLENLGAAIDLAQLWPLIYSFFMRKFSSPTPREMIELTAPPTFDYASYYNYFLFYSTVALCFGGLQPLVLPATALYFSIDVWLKKYLLLYIFVTKNESGGMFWRTIYNRFVFGTILANLVTFLAVFVRGDGQHIQAFATVPLPFIMIIFKIYCARTFDAKIHFYSTASVNRNPNTGALKDPLRSSNLAARFGHPALYRNLITPMPMNSTKPGKSAGVPGFELVPESRLDFEYYKNRSEFASDHGNGNLFGRSNDMMRPGTPGSMWDGSESNSRSASPAPPVPRIPSPGPSRILSPASDIGMTYPTGYSRPMGSPYSPTPYSPPIDLGHSRSTLYSQGNDSNSNLVGNAAPMPVASRSGFRERSVERLGRTPGGAGMLGGGPQGYGGLPQDEEVTSPDHDPMQYNYFREARKPRRDNSGGW
ncbi:hypothetical protein E0Z10_g1254 [Xylaria hypoxylon]|uniref:CSC1/OSCA1-like 7TM region domain-containing protein n=1 Tax=Xylaria hypoxylon TaxID=37992 RepID=A0A4Z0Z998_9PEZI|nr:hypothetical protein E0Z10_g1254 [Xylaria hypoxylon]